MKPSSKGKMRAERRERTMGMGFGEIWASRKGPNLILMDMQHFSCLLVSFFFSNHVAKQEENSSCQYD